jgi:hypothetical protein
VAKDLHLSFRFVQFHLGPGVSFDDPHGLTLSTQDFADFLADEANEPTDEGMKPVGLKTLPQNQWVQPYLSLKNGGT